MTKLEMTIRQVSDLRDFYMKIKKKSKNHKAGNKALPPTSMVWDVKVVKPLPDHKCSTKNPSPSTLSRAVL